jgi:uncharacterized protein (DUF4415 family)
MTSKHKKAKKKMGRKQVGIELRASAEDSFWAEVGKAGSQARWNRPRKRLISLRLDPDVLEWLQSQGPGYQTRINRILRRVMAEGKRKRE